MLDQADLSAYEEGVLGQLIQKQNKAFVHRDKLLAEQADYLQFSDALTKIEGELAKKDSPVKVMMDIGCNFYTEAVITDPNCVVVSLGKGFFAEMTLPEAKRFVSRKISFLKAVESLLSDEIAAAKAAYKLILGLKSVAEASM